MSQALDIVITTTDPQTESDPIKRGAWTVARRLEAIEACLRERPFEKPYKQKRGRLGKRSMKALINNTQPHPPAKKLKNLGATTIKEFINTKACEDALKKEKTEVWNTGTNDSETTLENRAYTLAELWKAQKEKDDEKNKKDADDQLNKRTMQARMAMMSMQGMKQKSTATTISDDPGEGSSTNTSVSDFTQVPDYLRAITEDGNVELTDDEDVYVVEGEESSPNGPRGIKT